MMFINRCTSEYGAKSVLVQEDGKGTHISVIYARKGSDSIGRPVYEIIVPYGANAKRRIAHGIEPLDEIIFAVVEGVYGLHSVLSIR